MMEKLRRLRQRILLALYKWAGSKLGPEVDSYWDDHWNRVLANRVEQVVDRASFGEDFLWLLFTNDSANTRDFAAREWRDETREIRDSR